MGNVLTVAPDAYQRLLVHLRQRGPEQVAFGYARYETRDGQLSLTIDDIEFVPRADFDHQSGFHVALTDAALARVIKTAWDSNTALVEFHSHTSPRFPAAFSPSDLDGLEELVPHVWWRLRGRPYVAVVVSPDGFDALVWHANPDLPEPLEALAVGSARYAPTGRTIAGLGRAHGS